MVANLILGILCLLLLAFTNDKKKGLKWVFFFVTLFLAIRYEWGNDYIPYLLEFQEFNGYSFSVLDVKESGSLNAHNEWGWVILNRIAGFSGLGFFGLVIILSIFENWVLYRMITKYVEPEYYWVSVFFMVFSTSFCVNASMMRQWLCICIYLIVVDIMIEKKIRYYLFLSIGLILIGSTIHRSNILMLITLPLFYIKFKSVHTSRFWLSIILIAFLLWSVFGEPLVDRFLNNIILANEEYESYSNYMHQNTQESNTGLGVIFRYIMFAVWLFLLPKVEKNKQTIIILGLFSYFFEVVMQIVPMASRFQFYFSAMDLLRWAWLFSLAKKYPILYSMLFVELLILVKAFPGFYFNPLWSQHFLKYHTIFEAGKWM